MTTFLFGFSTILLLGLILLTHKLFQAQEEIQHLQSRITFLIQRVNYWYRRCQNAERRDKEFWRELDGE